MGRDDGEDGSVDEMRGLVTQQSILPPPLQSLQRSLSAAGSPKSTQQLQQPSTASSPKRKPIEEGTANRGGERERNIIWLVVDATSVHD